VARSGPRPRPPVDFRFERARASADVHAGPLDRHDFNGAIYNFHDLRADLVRSGYSFKSQTDTEVLLHGYRE
jgi:asparagine synthetase B (glutamine-hydrolysing)